MLRLPLLAILTLLPGKTFAQDMMTLTVLCTPPVSEPELRLSNDVSAFHEVPFFGWIGPIEEFASTEITSPTMIPPPDPGKAKVKLLQFHFPSNSTEVSEDDTARIAAALVGVDAVRYLWLRGYADPSGGEARNIELSQERADAVYAAIRAANVPLVGATCTDALGETWSSSDPDVYAERVFPDRDRTFPRRVDAYVYFD